MSPPREHCASTTSPMREPMPRQSILTTPVAILLGAGIIATGAYFGLRTTHAPATPENRSIVQNAVATEPSIDPTSVVSPHGRPATIVQAALESPVENPSDTRLRDIPLAAIQERVISDVKDALEAQRSTLVELCWKPFQSASRSPSRVKLVLNYGFDPAGNQLSAGLREDREFRRGEVRECLQRTQKPLQVRSPGTHVVVDVPFELP